MREGCEEGRTRVIEGRRDGMDSDGERESKKREEKK